MSINNLTINETAKEAHKMRDVNEIILRMKEAIGAGEDKDLRTYFNIKSTGAISNWRERDSIPYSYIDQLVEETGRSFEWFLSGKEAKPVISELPVPYQSKKKYPADLQHIIDEWPELCEVQKSAVISVLDAFSKQDSNSLETNANKG